MLHDEKERAEHVMLVDLGRNDVGRVSEYGTVKVTSLMHVERYSHVMHLSALSRAIFARNSPPWTRFAPVSPPEPSPERPKSAPWRSSRNSSPRAAASMAAPFSTPTTPATSTPASRSARCWSKDKGYIQAGAGIVADSIPENEYQESLNKAKAVVRAVERAREG